MNGNNEICRVQILDGMVARQLLLDVGCCCIVMNDDERFRIGYGVIAEKLLEGDNPWR
jgi:hypothetical protein